MPGGPTQRQRDTLRAFDLLQVVNGIPPTQLELAGRLGCSISSVHEHVQELVAKGLMEQPGGRGEARSYMLTPEGHAWLSPQTIRLQEAWLASEERQRDDFMRWLERRGDLERYTTDRPGH